MTVTTFSEAVRIYAERAGLTPAQALAYRLGVLEARLIINTATANALAAPTERKIPTNA